MVRLWKECTNGSISLYKVAKTGSVTIAFHYIRSLVNHHHHHIRHRFITNEGTIQAYKNDKKIKYARTNQAYN